MAQPTFDSLTLNAGSGGSDLAGDSVSTKFWQAILVGFSTGDGSAKVVMADEGMPVVAATGATWTVTNSGTFAVQVSGDALTALQLIDDPVATIGSAVPAKGQAVAGSDGTNARLLKTDSDGHVQVDVLSSALPTGAATEVTLAAVAGYLDTEIAAIVSATSSILAAIDTEVGAAASSLSLINGKVTACDTGAVVISSGTITTVSAVTAITNALPAGDNNIGNVDLVSLPAGNLGQQLAAASMSVAPATNIADGTYIGDIKFGESLPAGTAAIGKLAANDAVDIGDVTVNNAAGDAVYVQPGTAAVFQMQSNSANVATESTVGDCKTALQIVDDWDSSDDCRSVQQSAAAMDGATRCAVKRFRVKCGNGANTLISAVADKKFRIRSLAFLSTSATSVTAFLSTTTDTGVLGDSTNPLKFDLDGADGPAGVVLAHNPDGWLETSTANEALVCTLNAAQPVWCIGTYIEMA